MGVQNVFLIGAKSIGAYGGYETFVYKLAEYHKDNPDIKYHIACKANGSGSMDESNLDAVSPLKDNEFSFMNARCFKVQVPDIGAAQAVYYDLAALRQTCNYIEKNRIERPIIYIMTCRIGPFIKYYHKRIKEFGGLLYLNPDGHEWKRDKWPLLVKKYWKYSEGKMVKQSDLIVCDSKNIESYINQEYGKKCPLKTTFIAYGSDMTKSNLRDDDRMVKKWFSDHSVISGEYYLIVGRFVPENSYEIIIREFLKTDTRKSLIIIANQNEKLYSKILKKTNFTIDERIKFVGTVYNQELLKKIRENAYGYIHGHTVGGTNPSLIESLSSTNINLLRDVTFNREVAKDTALYWDDSDNSLCRLIDEVDTWSQEKRIEFGDKAKKRVSENYTWKIICDKYEELFIRKK